MNDTDKRKDHGERKVEGQSVCGAGWSDVDGSGEDRCP